MFWVTPLFSVSFSSTSNTLSFLGSFVKQFTWIFLGPLLTGKYPWVRMNPQHMISLNPLNPWANPRSPVPGAMIPILHLKTLEQRGGVTCPGHLSGQVTEPGRGPKSVWLQSIQPNTPA